MFRVLFLMDSLEKTLLEASNEPCIFVGALEFRQVTKLDLFLGIGSMLRNYFRWLRFVTSLWPPVSYEWSCRRKGVQNNMNTEHFGDQILCAESQILCEQSNQTLEQGESESFEHWKCITQPEKLHSRSLIGD